MGRLDPRNPTQVASYLAAHAASLSTATLTRRPHLSVRRPSWSSWSRSAVRQCGLAVIRVRLAAAGIDPTCYSGHSLRAGLATSAGQAGVPTWKIRQQTGHASDAMLSRYVRDGELFVGNAVSALL